MRDDGVRVEQPGLQPLGYDEERARVNGVYSAHGAT